jgi:hypothetical protein
MRTTFGQGGWVGIDDVGLPGPLYVRLRPAKDGRLEVREIYIDASESDNPVTRRDLRELPLSTIETVANMPEHAREITRFLDAPSPDLSTSATYFGSRFNPATWGHPEATHSWVSFMLGSQMDKLVEGLERGVVDGPKIVRAKRVRRNWRAVTDDRDFNLAGGPTEGLTDEFLRDVARAYSAAVNRGEQPNKSIAEQTSYSMKTVRGWVYIARQRGIMPRGRRGRVS